jgi:hypothetical protein
MCIKFYGMNRIESNRVNSDINVNVLMLLLLLTMTLL